MLHNVLILVSVIPKNSIRFNVDNIRVVKILGGGIYASNVVRGMMFKREVEGTLTRVENAKIAVFSCPFDMLNTETKGTVLIKNAEELKNFSKGEENLLEDVSIIS